MTIRKTSLAPILWEALCRLSADHLADPDLRYTCFVVKNAATYKARDKGAYTFSQRLQLEHGAKEAYRSLVDAGCNRVGFKTSKGRYQLGNKSEQQQNRAQMLYLAYLQAKDRKINVDLLTQLMR